MTVLLSNQIIGSVIWQAKFIIFISVVNYFHFSSDSGDID